MFPLIITQTGGQCRASNYIALIKKGIADAGYAQVPVLSMALGSGLMNEQSGFTIPWAKIMPVALAAILYGDCISKFYFASAVREKEKGAAMKLRLHYLDECKKVIATGRTKDIYKLEYKVSEILKNIVFIFIRGIATEEGTRILNKFLENKNNIHDKH